jgi:ribosomal protein S18
MNQYIFSFSIQDVLILRQFTDANGKQIPKEVTGLCKQQHKRMKFLLVMAEKAG